jgi:hypothetical protein
VDVTDIGQQSGSAGGADAVEAQQGGAAGNDELGEMFVSGLDLLVDGLEFGDQLDSQPAAGLAHDVPWLDRGDQGADLGRGEELLGSTGKQLEQQPVEAVDGLCPRAAEFVATVYEHAHHDQLRVDLNADQVRGVQRGQGD